MTGGHGSAILAASVALLGACTTPAGNGYDPATQARIRVYHGSAAYLVIDDGCGRRESIHAAAGGFSYFVPNKTLGMPRPADMPSFSFHEYALPAGRLVTVSMYWQMQDASGIWRRCGPQQVSFRPYAGYDYEAFMPVEAGVCQALNLRKLVRDSQGRLVSEPASLSVASRERC